MTISMGSVATIHQRFYNAELPPITLEILDLASLTTESVSDLIATLAGGTRLGIAASYGKKCALETLAFSTETRVLLIRVGAGSSKSKSVKARKGILREKLLCNASLEKHGFFMERIAAALRLDLGLLICNAFDIASDGDRRGSMAAYKAVVVRGRIEHSVNQSVVEEIFTEQPFILSRANEFALRAWACFVGVQGVPSKPGVIDTSVKTVKARSKLLFTIFGFHLTPPSDRTWIGCANVSVMQIVWTP